MIVALVPRITVGHVQTESIVHELIGPFRWVSRLVHQDLGTWWCL